MNKENPRISVVVVVYNGEETLSACLDSLIQIDFPKEQLEIIIVDNNSTDNTEEIIKKYPFKYVFAAKKGRGAARNAGITASSGEFIAFTDSDCVVDKNWLKELIKGFDSEDIAACGGKISAFKTDNWLERYAESRDLLGQEDAISSDLRRDLPRVVTASAVFRRDILEELGNFDENLITSEDTDIGWQVTFSGLRLKYIPEAIVYHKHINNLWRYCLHQIDFGIANYCLMKKYGFLSGRLSRKIKSIFLLIKRLTLIPVILIAQLMSRKEDNKGFLFLDALTILFTILGKFRMVIKDLFMPDTLTVSLRPTLLKNFSNNLKISDTCYSWVLASNVLWFVNEGTVKFRNCRNGLFYRLNNSATRIWQTLLNSEDIFSASGLIAEHFSIPKDIALSDVRDLINQLNEESLLTKTKNEN